MDIVYSEQEMVILSGLVSLKEEWIPMAKITNNLAAILRTSKDGFIQVHGKNMKLTGLGRAYLRSVEKR